MIKKWNDYIKEAVEGEQDVQGDMTQRVEDLEKIRAEVLKIKALADSLKSVVKIEDLDTRLDTVTKQYENQKDSLITTALAYYKMLLDKQRLDIKQKQYESEIPTLAGQLETDLRDLVERIAEIRKGATK